MQNIILHVATKNANNKGLINKMEQNKGVNGKKLKSHQMKS